MGRKGNKEEGRLGSDEEKGRAYAKGPRPFPLRIWWAALAVAFITFIVFLPSLNNGFVNWDDDVYVSSNNTIRSLSPDSLKQMFRFYEVNWIPLTWLSYAIDYQLWGLTPAGYHLTNIVLHSINTFLLCLLVAYLILSRNKGKSFNNAEGILRKALVAGGVTALLFGIHPVHVESVVWVSERKDVLSTFFVLLTLIAYVKYAGAGESRGQSGTRYYVLGLVFFLLALMSKPMAITLPVILMLLDVYPLERFHLRRGVSLQKRVFLEKVPFIVLALGSAILTIMVQQRAIKPAAVYPFANRIVMAIKGTYFYLEKMVLPLGLSPYYPYPTRDISFLFPRYFVPLLVVILLSAFSVWAWRKGWKVFAAIWAYYLVTLLPVIGIVQIGGQAAADRYTYMPSIGPFFLAGLGIAVGSERVWGAGGVSGRSGRVLFLLPVLLFSLLGALTIRQINVWKDSVALWSSVQERFPDYPDAYFRRADGYANQGNYREAIKDSDRVIALDPLFHEAYNYRGLYYKATGDYASAFRDFSKTIELKPGFAKAYTNRADLHVRMGNHQKALEDLHKALALEPQSVGPYINICEVNNLVSNFAQALSFCSKGVEVDPDNALAYRNRGVSYNAMGKYDEAIADYRRAISLDSRDYKSYELRGIAYKNQGEYANAILDFTRALELNPKSTVAHMNRGIVFGATGQLEESVKEFTKAIELNPQNGAAYYNRGASYFRLERKEEAVADFRKAAGLGDKEVQRILRERGISWQ